MTAPVPAPQGATVAVLEKRGRFLVAEPLFPPRRGEEGPASGGSRGRLVVDPRASRSTGRRAAVGDLVLVSTTGRTRGRVVRILGRPDVARDVIEGLMLDRGLRRGFDPAVEREARLARDRGAESAVGDGQGARRDLRDLATFTIDPISARDFDDAVSAECRPDGVTRVWVHIADVAAFVPEGSLVDREARRRATSVYVPGAVEPMLPEPLSNDACSLVPGRDRLAVTVELDLRGAHVQRASFYRSLIRSDERLDYDRVDRIFAGRERAHAPWEEALKAARGAAWALEDARRRRGALTLDSPEPEFTFHADGHVVGVQGREQTEAHRLIEHLMIASNEAVARLLSERAVPTLYRVHERPQPERVKRLVEQLASLEVATPPVPDPLSPSQAAELLGEISMRVEDHVRRTGHGRLALTSLVLRSLKQAYYSPRNLGHAGLGSTAYCHFTSPIRRYPDLVCHRALLSAVAGGPAPRASQLEELGGWTSERERYAMTIERDGDDVARCFLLEQRLYEDGWEAPFSGEVTGLIGAGAFVGFGPAPEPGAEGARAQEKGGGERDDGRGEREMPPFEGMLPVRRMGGEWWELNEEGTTLFGTRSERVLRLGDPIEVRVRGVEPPRGRVDLEPA